MNPLRFSLFWKVVLRPAAWLGLILSLARLALGAAMRFTLDTLLEAHPRAAGWIIAAGSLAASIGFRVMAFSLP